MSEPTPTPILYDLTEAMVCESESCGADAVALIGGLAFDDGSRKIEWEPQAFCEACHDALAFGIAKTCELLGPLGLEPLRLAIGVNQKVDTGVKYESVEASLHVSQITRYHTDEEIAELVDRSKVIISHMGHRLRDQYKAAKAARGWPAE